MNRTTHRIAAVISVFTVCVSTLFPISAQATPINTPYASSEKIPAVFNGTLHGTHTASLYSEVGIDATVTINYDNGMVYVTQSGDITRTESLAEIAKQLSSAIEGMSDEQRQELIDAAEQKVQSRGAYTAACSVLVSAISKIHGSAWEVALTLIGHPIIGAIVALGQDYFWDWVKTYC